MRRLPAAIALSVALVVLVPAAVERAGPGGAIDTDLRGLLPSAVQSPAEIAATERFQNVLQRRQFVLIEGPERREVDEVALEVRRQAKQSQLYTDDLDETTAGMARAAKFLFPYRYSLLTAKQRAAISRGEGRDAVQAALAAIYAPFATYSSDLLVRDPFLISTRLLVARAGNAPVGAMTARNGFMTAKSAAGAAILMVLRLKDSPFSASTETAIAALTARIDTSLAAKYPHVRVSRAGVIEHSYRAAAAVRKEVGVIGSLSIAGVLLLVISTFRSLVPLLASLIAVGASVVGGISAVIIVNGSINMISVVAGTSLIGISVDYAFHYYAELRYGSAAGDPAAALSHIWPGIVLGFVTTLIAFVGMALPPFPALRELALFSGVGIGIAFLTVWTVFPLLPSARGDSPSARKGTTIPASALIGRWLAAADRADPRWVVCGLLVAATACAALLVLFLRPVDDVRALQPTNDDVTAAERRLSAFAGSPLASQYLLVEGGGTDQVLEREEALMPTLRNLAAQGSLGGYAALSQLVPSQASQRASLIAVSGLASGDPAPIDQLVAAVGLDPAAGRTFRADLKGAQLLRPSTVIASGLFSDLTELWLGRVGDHVASVIALRDPVPVAALKAAVTNLGGIRFVDPVSSVDTLIQHYRSFVEWMIAGAYLAILGLLALRYGPRGAILAVMPPVVAGLGGVVALVLTGQIYSVFATVGLILVLGIGIDYTLFFLEGPGDPQATALAVVMSAASTLLAFGLLAFSTTPAVHTFGVTICVGMTIAFLLSPLARGGRSRHDESGHSAHGL